MKRQGALILVGGVILLAAAAWFFFRGGAASRPNVLLVTIDTLRVDRIGAYGSKRTRTPSIDRLAAEGVLFENAVCPMPMTRPSHFSIFTSLYPRRHGVMNNAATLPAGHPTLTEILREAGYRTAGFVGVKLLDAESGAGRGFETFDSPRGARTRDAGPIVRRAIEWLAGPGRDGAFFLWVHLFDPHTPYSPPPRHDPGGPPDVVRDLPMADWDTLRSLAERNGGDLPEAVFERAVRLYDAEVNALDDPIGKLVDALRESERLDDTIVVFTADHGECFDHGTFFDHSECLYEGAVRVPLVIRHPSRLAGETRQPELAELVDVAPTILSLAGLPSPAAFEGRDLFAAGDERRSFSVIETPVYDLAQHSGRAARHEVIRSVGGRPTRPAIADGRQRTIRGTEWKLVVGLDGDELYRPAEDADEERNVVVDHPDVARELRGRLEEWLAARPAAAAPEESGREIRETLKALGYVQ